jgi:hypothetical protein
MIKVYVSDSEYVNVPANNNHIIIIIIIMTSENVSVRPSYYYPYVYDMHLLR